MGMKKYVPIHNWDNEIASTIKGKLNEAGGEAIIKNGTSNFKIGYAEDESGISFATPKGEEKVLPWNAFFATVDILKENEGKAIKGDATKGKLGCKELPLDSVEGYVAATVYGKKKRQTVEKNVSQIGALLEWTDIAKNGRGYLELKKDYR
ncbi:MAG: hypothetical protein E7311_01640 [Clostridiales bacterium]|nr:hypothetical protein [Clostridiales bacterium]